MVEREVEVIEVAQDGVRLRLIGTCRGCGGCAGRCGLLDGADDESGRLELGAFPEAPLPGQRFCLSLGELDLLRAARWGYGLPLLGLLLGGGVGTVLGPTLGFEVNVATLLGALSGTSLAFAGSKRLAPRPLPHVRACGSAATEKAAATHHFQEI